MQQEPLLEQIDWCFTSSNWITQYLNTLLLPMSKPTSDHIPCMVQIDTLIPKTDVFRFENFWVEQPDFLDLVKTLGILMLEQQTVSQKSQPSSNC